MTKASCKLARCWVRRLATDHHSRIASFQARDVEIRRAKQQQLKPKPDPNNLRFGHHFSDHMVTIHWTAAQGWDRPVIKPFENLSLHPAAKCLHYAIELFEGMKAYRGVDNKIRLFRPNLNMKRMIRTAHRAGLPGFEGEELLKLIDSLIVIDKEWVPYSTTSSLYVRPTFIGTAPTLGVSESYEALLYVVVCPVGAFFPTGFKPVSLYADSDYVRACRGGVGAYKMGANYAPTILVGKAALEAGCQQVLWLYGEEELVTEVGTMNLFVLWTNEDNELELITPPLDEGIILPGVTRQTLLDISREWGEFRVTERNFSIHDVRRALAEKRCHEMFGAGTACIVSPVSHILYKQGEYNMEDLFIPTMTHTPNLMQRLYNTITDLQYGRIARPDWVRVLVE